MQLLIAFIGLLIVGALITTASIFAFKVGYIKRNAELAEKQQKQTEDELKALQSVYDQLEHAYNTELGEKQRAQKILPISGYNPGNPLMSEGRR